MEKYYLHMINSVHGSKRKIYNNDLARLDKQALDRCPPYVTDAFNIMVYDPLRKRVYSPLIILKVSDSMPPNTVSISPYRIKVQNYQATSNAFFVFY